jgi:DNA-binding CsgD family transcriptional regulator
MTERLTATERQVALLVTWGATKKQVADLLHLSPKAVEWHLAQINGKPGSRAELPDSPGSSAVPTKEAR